MDSEENLLTQVDLNYLIAVLVRDRSSSDSRFGRDLTEELLQNLRICKFNEQSPSELRHKFLYF